jgi:hypothetical protein
MRRTSADGSSAANVASAGAIPRQSELGENISGRVKTRQAVPRILSGPKERKQAICCVEAYERI